MTGDVRTIGTRSRHVSTPKPKAVDAIRTRGRGDGGNVVTIKFTTNRSKCLT